MLKDMIKKIFKKEEKAKWHVETITITKKMTESIEISKDEPNSLVVTQEEKFWAPFTMPIEKEFVLSLHRDLNELRDICVSKEYEFVISPLMNDYHRLKGKDMRRHILINPNKEDNHVFDIDLLFNKQGRIDSFAVGTRPRFYAFAGEPPRVIPKTSLKEFNKAMEYLKEKI